MILANARTLYEKYDAGRPDPFNVFTVLRSRSDEVNLHSRFLRALLDHREPGREKTRQNLKDFLERLAVESDVSKIKDYDIRNAEVQREKYNIDLLIINRTASPQWAVVVENKIWADDQPQQLKRYYDSVSRIPGIDEDNIHIFYLTPYGHEASEDSGEGTGYQPISYKDDIRSWLEACQRRAVNNPALRESLAQYIEVVRGLTGQNIDEEYMEELKDLCLEEKNLVLVSHLNKAHEKACIHLVKKMWEHIKEAMEIKFEETGILEIGPDPRRSCVSENGDVDEAKIKKKQRSGIIEQHGLFYQLRKSDVSVQNNPPSLAVKLEDGSLRYGVSCKRENFEKEFEAIKERLRGESGIDTISQWGWWPWGRDVSDKLGIANLRIGERPEQWLRLKDEGLVKECAQEIAEELKCISKKLPECLTQDLNL